MSDKFSIKAVLRTDKILKNGKHPISIQVIINSSKKRISIGESIDLKDWDKKNGLATGKGYKDLNSKLINERSGLDKYLRNANLAGIPLTFRLVDDYFKKTDNNNFYTVFDFIVDLKSGLSKDTLYKYETLRKRLKGFKSTILVSDVDLAFITKFDNYLKTLDIGEGGIYNHHKCLKCIINEAIEHKKFTIDNPYKSKKSIKVKSPNHREVFLEEDEVLKIKKYRPTSKTLKVVKDMFLLSCYTGLRYSDLFSLKISDLDWERKIISKQMLKTKHTIDIPLNSQIRGLLVRYLTGNKKAEDKVFPEVDNQVGNRLLKDIARECKITKNLTFHVGRHTFASFLINDKNVSLSLVSKLLGHRRIANTMVYANSNIKNLRKVMDVNRFG
ncbi:site-specific integrase [uncultured Chryseobacterium sp.]|jgi:Site-specific recombinase XerD|uniref:site-specific integrase n=1 Tax=uncultured Chryseobacterium sp. TaxID=259322 RepID=UPI00262006FF|nr:site-specific integrase [uncultured Chryseobacterium sp.]